MDSITAYNRAIEAQQLRRADITSPDFFELAVQHNLADHIPALLRAHQERAVRQAALDAFYLTDPRGALTDPGAVFFGVRAWSDEQLATQQALHDAVDAAELLVAETRRPFAQAAAQIDTGADLYFA